MKRAWAVFLRVFGGFELAVVTLFLMTWLTWRGTMNQVSEGLFVSQARYFESWFVIDHMGPFGVPLPGGQTLMILLFVNLLVGGVMRMRLGKSTVGILVTHLGILLLLIAGGVKLYASTEGNLRLWPGEQGDTFSSFHFWELEVRQELEGGKQRQFLLDHEAIVSLGKDDTRRVDSPHWPFTLLISDFVHNVEPRRAGGHGVTVGGLRLEPLPRQLEEELNIAGMRVRAVADAGEGGEPQVLSEGLLWGVMPHPHVFEIDGVKFGVKLQRRREKMPFTVRLDEFHHEVYPNTTRPRVFSSDVTVLTDVANEEARKAVIEMNQPLRREGYVLFQASFGPKNARPGDRKFSVFQVVRNPSDHWPLYACFIIALGLMLHFGVKLGRWMRAERKRALKASV